MGSTRLRDLKPEYQKLWDSCKIRPEAVAPIKTILEKIQSNRSRYEAVQKATNVPWSFIALIHNMESSLNFNGHLHNGDSLKKRTVQVPAGRPIAPPAQGWTVGYTWEESAIDALYLKEFDQAQDWSLPAQLWRLELYNGFGYRLYHPEVLTPYLWSGTHHYSQGKYTADGKWDAKAKSAQIGAAAILKQLLSRGTVELEPDNSPETGKEAVLVVTQAPGTFLKAAPEQSAGLEADEKQWLTVGTSLAIASWQKQGKHYQLTFTEENWKPRNQWFIFTEHCELKVG